MSPSQQCVVKQLLRSRGSREADLAEAKQLAVLGEHPQIPRLIAVLESSRDLCLVQDYIAGPNLEQRLEAEGVFDEAAVRSLLLSLLPVLDFIHQKNIIHRDIKPENILLAGADQTPMLVDFGAARSAPTTSELVRSGTVIGSAGYAAPEQALGKAVPPSDLFGLGMTCLHLLTGQHPFDLYAVDEDQWVWQAFLPTPLSTSLSRVLNRLTARSLRSRYATAAAVLADLNPAGILPARSPRNGSLVLPAPAWQCHQVWPTAGRIVNDIGVLADDHRLVTANSDDSVQLWERRTGQITHTFARKLGLGAGHTDAVTAIAVHPHAPIVFTGSQDGTIRQWNVEQYRVVDAWQQPGWQVTAIVLSSDGDWLLAAAKDGRISLWHVATGTRQRDLVRHAAAVNDLVISPDDQRLASVGEDCTLRLWSLPEGRLLHTWTAHQPLRSLALCTTRPAIITGDATGQVTAWSLTDFDQATLIDKHEDAVTAIALSPDGQLLATGSRDRAIHLWQWSAHPPHRLATLYHDWAVTHLLFTPDSRTLISSAADETIRFWQARSTSTESTPTQE